MLLIRKKTFPSTLKATIMTVARKLRPLYVRTAFDAAGGTAEYDHGVYAVGEPYGSLPTAVKPEWNFVKWVFADGSAALPTTPARDGDLTAVWSQLPLDDRLWFLAKEDSTIELSSSGGPTLTLETSLNGGAWTAWDGSAKSLSRGEYLVVRAGPAGNPNGTATGYSAYNKFVLTGRIEAHGNIMSLFDADGETRQLKGYCFAHLFEDQTALVSAPLFDFDTISGQYPTASMFRNTSVTRVVLGRGAQRRLADYNWLNGCPEYGQLIQPAAAETNSNASRGSGNTPTYWAVLNYGAAEGDPYVVDNTKKTDGLMDGRITNSLPDDLDYVIRIPHTLFAQYEADPSWGAFAGRFVADAERSWDVADAQISLPSVVPVFGEIVPEVRDNFGYAMAEGTDYETTFAGSTSSTGEVVVAIEGRGRYTGRVEKAVTVAEQQDITTIRFSDGKPDLHVSKETLTWQDVGKTTDF